MEDSMCSHLCPPSDPLDQILVLKMNPGRRSLLTTKNRTRTATMTMRAMLRKGRRRRRRGGRRREGSQGPTSWTMEGGGDEAGGGGSAGEMGDGCHPRQAAAGEEAGVAQRRRSKLFLLLQFFLQ